MIDSFESQSRGREHIDDERIGANGNRTLKDNWSSAVHHISSDDRFAADSESSAAPISSTKGRYLCATNEQNVRILNFNQPGLSNQNSCPRPFKSPMRKPNEWREALTQNGKIYYYNRQTRETAWKLPSDAMLSRRRNPNYDSASKEKVTIAKGDDKMASIQIECAKFPIENIYSESRQKKQDKEKGNEKNTTKIGPISGLSRLPLPTPPTNVKGGGKGCEWIHTVESSSVAEDYFDASVDELRDGKNDKYETCMDRGQRRACSSPRRLFPPTLNAREEMISNCHAQEGLDCGKKRSNGAINRIFCICCGKNCNVDSFSHHILEECKIFQEEDAQSMHKVIEILLLELKKLTVTQIPAISRSLRLHIDEPVDEENYIKSKCPFCKKLFLKNGLSRHLLCCKSRKSARERRVTSATPEHNLKTKLKQDSLNEEGRQLPGHPKAQKQ